MTWLYKCLLIRLQQMTKYFYDFWRHPKFFNLFFSSSSLYLGFWDKNFLHFTAQICFLLLSKYFLIGPSFLKILIPSLALFLSTFVASSVCSNLCFLFLITSVILILSFIGSLSFFLASALFSVLFLLISSF